MWYDRKPFNKNKERKSRKENRKMIKRMRKNMGEPKFTAEDEKEFLEHKKYRNSIEGKIYDFLCTLMIAEEDMQEHGKGYARAENQENYKNIEYHRERLHTLYIQLISMAIKMERTFKFKLDDVDLELIRNDIED